MIEKNDNIKYHSYNSYNDIEVWYGDRDKGKFIISTVSEYEADTVVNELNTLLSENIKLKKENKQLKEDNEFAGLLANHRGEMVSFANSLIQDLDDEKIQDMWEKFKDEMYNEWKQKRGIE